MSDLYTIQLELGYSLANVNINQETITQLLGLQEDIYISYIDDNLGIVKILVSKTGEKVGKDGAFDILSFNINLNTEEITNINLNLVKIVDSKGHQIEILEPSQLKIKQLSEEQRIY